MQIKKVNRITHIAYTWRLPFSVVEQGDFLMNSYSAKANDTVSIYEWVDAGENSEVQFWTFERDGNRKCFDNGNSFFESLESPATSFAGNHLVSKEILTMSWLPWEDELVLASNFKLIEAVGDDYSGEINLSKIKKPLEKFDMQNIIVFRNIYLGDESIAFDAISSSPLFTPDSFEPNDRLEAARMTYRSKT